LPKIIKTRGYFPTDEAAVTLLWLVLRNGLAKSKSIIDSALAPELGTLLWKPSESMCRKALRSMKALQHLSGGWLVIPVSFWRRQNGQAVEYGIVTKGISPQLVPRANAVRLSRLRLMASDQWRGRSLPLWFCLHQGATLASNPAIRRRSSSSS